jgi:hypothetical protein
LSLVSPGTIRDKQNKVHEVIREGAKRFRYAFPYGVGLTKAGQIISDIVRAAHQIDTNDGLQQRFFNGSSHPNETALKQVGKQALNRFEAGTPGLRQLRDSPQPWLASWSRRSPGSGARAAQRPELHRHIQRGDHLQALASRRL